MGFIQKIRQFFGGKQLEKSLLSQPVILPDGFIRSDINPNSLEALFEATAWSYACIVTNALEAASLGVQVQVLEDGQWLRAPSNELEGFLLSPSGPQRAGNRRAGTIPPQWAWSQLVQLMASHLYLDGNAYLVPKVVNRGQKLYSVAPLIPTDVTVESADSGYPSGYCVGAEKYQPHQVVHIMFTSPLDFSQGHAPIKAAMRAMFTDNKAADRIYWNLENRASPGLIIKIKELMGLTEPQRQEWMKFIASNYRASYQDGMPMVLGDNADVNDPPKQGLPNYREIRHDVRDEILSIFRTPPPVVGVYDNATLNNFDAAFKNWWRLGLFPLLEMIYSAINTQLIHPVYGPRVRLWYDQTGSEIALLLLKERIEAANGLVAMGYPPNIAAKRLRLEMPHVKELDKPLQNLALAGRDQGDE